MDEVAAHPGLPQPGAAALSFANVLLDGDDALTRIGSLTSVALPKLRARIEELLTGSTLDDGELP